MAQTPGGARKIAASRLGLSLVEYEARLSGGLKHCTKCKSWKASLDFNVDKSRRDGLSAKCRQCNSRGNYPAEMTRSERIKAAWVRRRPTFIPPMKGKRMSVESRKKMSDARKGKPGIGRPKGLKHTTETKAKIAMIVRQRTPRGAAHYAYSHGKHQRDKCDRRTVEYRQWRDAVYERDGYTCQHCGDARGGNLQAHHVKPFADHPELRFDVANGLTLCRDCHEKVHLKPIPGFKCRRKKHAMPAS